MLDQLSLDLPGSPIRLSGDRARRSRSMAGLSLKQAATLLDLDVPRLSSIEVSESIEVSPDLGSRMADVYLVSVDWLSGAEARVPDSFRRLVSDADISPRDREVILEFAGALSARSNRDRSERADRPARDASSPPAGQDRSSKVKYVIGQKQTRHHGCHWPGCDEQVPPARWGCRRHWLMLPRYLRDKIWDAFRPGQERDMSPSRSYLAAAREVQDWIASRHDPSDRTRVGRASK